MLLPNGLRYDVSGKFNDLMDKDRLTDCLCHSYT